MPDVPQPARNDTVGDPGPVIAFSGEPERGRTPDNNLPISLSGLVWREREIEEVESILADRRLLTLNG